MTVFCSRLPSDEVVIKMCKSLNLRVYFKGGGNWSLRFRGGLEVFERRVKTCVRESQNVTGDWRKLRNEEHNTLYISP
jgi:hypothetical protein